MDVQSISIDTDKPARRKVMKDENMPWEQILSPNNDKTMEQFQFSGIPAMYIIDPAGKTIKSYVGYGPDNEAGNKSMLDNKGMAPKERKSIPAMSFKIIQ